MSQSEGASSSGDSGSSTVAQKEHTNSAYANGHCSTLGINELSRGLQECLTLKTKMKTVTSEF